MLKSAVLLVDVAIKLEMCLIAEKKLLKEGNLLANLSLCAGLVGFKSANCIL